MKKIIYAILLLVSLIFFKQINLFLHQIGFGWTSSFFLPYILLLILGILFAFSIKGFLRLLPISLKWILVMLIAIIPFGVGFALHPIYEGDIALGGSELNDIQVKNETKGYDLMVITIPNCPFCMESTQKVNKLIERNPNLKIKYVICSSDPLALKQLRTLLNKSVTIELAKDSQQMAGLATGAFPCFLKVKNDQIIYKWSNDQFGIFALDKVEANDF